MLLVKSRGNSGFTYLSLKQKTTLAENYYDKLLYTQKV